MKIELLKQRTVKGERRKAGWAGIVDKETGQRLVEDGGAIEIIDVRKTQTRVIDPATTATRTDFGPPAFANSTRRFA